MAAPSRIPSPLPSSVSCFLAFLSLSQKSSYLCLSIKKKNVFFFLLFFSNLLLTQRRTFILQVFLSFYCSFEEGIRREHFRRARYLHFQFIECIMVHSSFIFFGMQYFLRFFSLRCAGGLASFIKKGTFLVSLRLYFQFIEWKMVQSSFIFLVCNISHAFSVYVVREVLSGQHYIK